MKERLMWGRIPRWKGCDKRKTDNYNAYFSRKPEMLCSKYASFYFSHSLTVGGYTTFAEGECPRAERSGARGEGEARCIYPPVIRRAP